MYINLSGTFLYDHYAQRIMLMREEGEQEVPYTFGPTIYMNDTDGVLEMNLGEEKLEIKSLSLVLKRLDRKVRYVLFNIDFKVLFMGHTASHAAMLIVDREEREAHYFNPTGIEEDWSMNYDITQWALPRLAKKFQKLRYRMEDVALACPIQSILEEKCKKSKFGERILKDRHRIHGLCATWPYIVMKEFIYSDDKEIQKTSKRLLKSGCKVLQTLHDFIESVWVLFVIDFPAEANMLVNDNPSGVADIASTKLFRKLAPMMDQKLHIFAD
jgi:hypothetical protein